MHTKQNHRNGFSLIELCIVMMISGLLLSGFLHVQSASQQKQRYDTTKMRLRDIRTALTLYVVTRGHLPCPASPSGDYSADQCADSGAGPGKDVGRYNINPTRMPTSPLDEVWTGIIPMQELRFDREQIQDGWGNRFTYAVSRRLTLPSSMRGNPLPLGIISVVDENGNSMLDKPGTGRYVVLSHGPTGAGAWLPGGGRKPCTEKTLDGQNCLGLNVFVLTPESGVQGPHFYDDIVIHDDQNAGGPLVDSLAICSAKEGFYAPANPYADQDGCILSRRRLR
jgi:prepilin-type N-terminal cleavage/methylation domain-containing protein